MRVNDGAGDGDSSSDDGTVDNDGCYDMLIRSL